MLKLSYRRDICYTNLDDDDTRLVQDDDVTVLEHTVEG